MYSTERGINCSVLYRIMSQNKEYIGIAIHKDVYRELKVLTIRTRSSMSSTIALLLDHYKRTAVLPEILDELINEIRLLKEKSVEILKNLENIRKELEEIKKNQKNQG